MEIQWFPGHMAKTRRLISESLKLVDVVIELVDSRLPLSSRNPEIDSIVGTRPRILVLNKCDISDEAVNLHWLEYFKSRGTAAFLADSRSGNGFSALMPAVDAVLKEKFERDRSRGIQRSSVKMMVVGIPNVGKSVVYQSPCIGTFGKDGRPPRCYHRKAMDKNIGKVRAFGYARYAVA